MLKLVPLLADHHDRTPRFNVCLQQMLFQPRRERIIPVVKLSFLSVVHTARMVAADPLAPAMEMELSVATQLVPGEVRRTDEEQMRFVAFARESGSKTAHARAKPAGTGIRIQPLEAQKHEYGRKLASHGGRSLTPK
jgi:hypothetical protein